MRGRPVFWALGHNQTSNNQMALVLCPLMVVTLAIFLLGTVLSDSVHDNEIDQYPYLWLPDFMRYDNGFYVFAFGILVGGFLAFLFGIAAYGRNERLWHLAAVPSAAGGAIAVYCTTCLILTRNLRE